MRDKKPPSEPPVTGIVLARPEDLAPGHTTGPADNPVVAYLASLQSPTSREKLLSCLRRAARLLAPPADPKASGPDPFAFPWASLRHTHFAALCTRMAALYAPATGNTVRAAVRGVLRQAWLLGQLSADEWARVGAVRPIRGSRIQAGRLVRPEELAALAATLGTDPISLRDAALLALLHACGLRCAEAVGLDLGDLDRATGVLRVMGKGNKERLAFAAPALVALEAWIAVRGLGPGALFRPFYRGKRAKSRRLSTSTVQSIITRRSEAAGVGSFSPHDLRRTFISERLSEGNDLATAQRLAGHADPSTTARYDRRPDEALAAVMAKVRTPFSRGGT